MYHEQLFIHYSLVHLPFNHSYSLTMWSEEKNLGYLLYLCGRMWKNRSRAKTKPVSGRSGDKRFHPATCLRANGTKSRKTMKNMQHHATSCNISCNIMQHLCFCWHFLCPEIPEQRRRVVPWTNFTAAFWQPCIQPAKRLILGEVELLQDHMRAILTYVFFCF